MQTNEGNAVTYQDCLLCGHQPPYFKDTGDALCFTRGCKLEAMTFTRDEWNALTKDDWQTIAQSRRALLPQYRSKGRRKHQ